MTNKTEYAGFSIRSLAYLTDCSFLFVPQAIFCYFISQSIFGLTDLITAALLYFALFVFPGFIISILYYSLTTANWGATPGKLMARLRVVNEKNEKISLKISLFRHSVGYAVAGLLLWLGFFWIIKDKNKQGWHDQISNTYVVQKTKNVPFLLIITFVFLLFLNLTLTYQSFRNITLNTGLRRDVEEIEKLIRKTFKETSPYKSPPTHSQIS